jgi:AraC-like DNA-binding protein
MLYDPRLLCARVSALLDQNPSRSLEDLSQELGICSKTIQNAVADTTGRKFTDFKADILIAKLTCFFAAKPFSLIKQVSVDLGYKSTRTFTRAVRRACGASPAELRNQIVSELASGAHLIQ